MTKILITGGCGFIGHYLVQHVFNHTDWNIVVIDKLSYASKGLERLRNAKLLNSDRIQVFTNDLSLPMSEGTISEIGSVDYIVHMASETHVDKSIKEPVMFIQNNVMSTVYMLEYARTLPSLKKFFYFSTDEVYGLAPNNVVYSEWDRHRPTNPYSASKSASESICISYENTYKLPIIITNCMNVFGEGQHVEKYIPKVIRAVINGKEVQVHSDKTCTKPGSRFYVHARTVVSAVMFLIEHGVNGEKYNIVGEREVDNLEMAQFIADVIGKELKYELVNFHQDRPGHDLRYGLNGDKLLKLGWKLPNTFEQSLRDTVLWTLENREWLDD